MKFHKYLPLKADKKRRVRPASARIGTETRFRGQFAGRRHGTPGPVYDPPHKVSKHKYSKYTFGYRRKVKGQSPLEQTSCTPARVGPGLYLSKKRPLTRYYLLISEITFKSK
jgi:hypothetical protein